MQILVSVRNADEAEIAMAAGVRLIDLKEPAHGALAALNRHDTSAVMEAVQRHRQRYAGASIQVSATVGDTVDDMDTLMSLISDKIAIGVNVIKLPTSIWSDLRVIARLSPLPAGVQWIAVLSPLVLTDARGLLSQLASVRQLGYKGVMVDTQEKSVSLPALLTIEQLTFFVQSAREAGLYTGLAGGLRLEHLASLATLQADYLGFRSGLCQQSVRANPLLPERLHALRPWLSHLCQFIA